MLMNKDPAWTLNVPTDQGKSWYSRGLQWIGVSSPHFKPLKTVNGSLSVELRCRRQKSQWALTRGHKKRSKADLERWTSHSKDGKLSWSDRAQVGSFKQHQIKSMSRNLQSCKITINSIIGIAKLYSSIRRTHATKEIRKAISST
ncbi:hypothetical protein GX51_01531 [Blastomyces parvus]|uniref:Uncharacterized protein n=1 Tax=Blastomyces parvus TaxID=2060905 RepID=A0A2B7XGC2_9EURO|nr:hypothetical protein GX51_01531 [Blastomyces parvus]